MGTVSWVPLFTMGMSSRAGKPVLGPLRDTVTVLPEAETEVTWARRWR